MATDNGRQKAQPDYLKRSTQPLHCLIFLLPFLAFYEIGLVFIRSHQINAAHALMLTVLKWVGITAYYAPAICVVVIFLIWQIGGKYSWRLSGWTLLGMLAESAMFTLPILVLHNLFIELDLQSRAPAEAFGRLAAAFAGRNDWFSQLVFSIGAGVYEELVFRLALVTGLAFLVGRLFRMKRQGSLIIAVLVSAALFSAFHYFGAYGEDFDWQSFLFRTSAAIYLSVLFASRGFGITAGAHMMFNCTLILLVRFA